MKRFRPYFRYLAAVRGPIAIAILCGVLYGAASGAGLPLLVKHVFPRIFAPDAAPVPFLQVALVAAYIPLIFALRAASGYLNGYFTQFAGVRVSRPFVSITSGSCRPCRSLSCRANRPAT